MSPAVAVCGWCRITSDLDPTHVRVIPVGPQVCNKSKFPLSGYLKSWPQMTFDLDLWPLTTWTYEGFHIISINQVWFKLDFNFSNEVIFTFSAYLTTWPQMTFDLGIWPLTAWKYEGPHFISINQVWFKSDLNFSNEAIFTFSAYLTIWPQMTFDLINKWGFPCCIYDPTLDEIHQSMWKIEPNVNPFFTTDNNRHQQTTTTDNNRGQSDPYVSFLLLRQATQQPSNMTDLYFSVLP